MTQLRELIPYLLWTFGLSAALVMVGAPDASAQTAADKREQWEPAVLEVVTNFDKADVKVNGIDYPEYTSDGDSKGMVLPAGGPYTVEVTYDGKTKVYKIHLRPRETRLLMVELSGYQGGSAGRAPQRSKRRQKKTRNNHREDREKKGEGRVTVYSKPKGQVMIDGRTTGEKTPGTVELEPGRHEVQVDFDGGDESETKVIRVRKGSRLKLFFRADDED